MLPTIEWVDGRRRSHPTLTAGPAQPVTRERADPGERGLCAGDNVRPAWGHQGKLRSSGRHHTKDFFTGCCFSNRPFLSEKPKLGRSAEGPVSEHNNDRAEHERRVITRGPRWVSGEGEVGSGRHTHVGRCPATGVLR